MMPEASAARRGRHRLKGYCPDGERCRYQQTPCVEHCSRLQAAEIAAELQANARAQPPASRRAAT